MSQNQTLVPNLRGRFLLVLTVLVVATVGLIERRTEFVLQDGTIVTGKIVEETDQSLTIEKSSGYLVPLQRNKIQEQNWGNIEIDLNLGLDLRGGTALRYRIDLTEIPEAQRTDILDRTVDTYKARLDTLGVKELSIRGAGEDEILIELPGISMEESGAYEDVVMSLGRLEFRLLAEDTPGILNVSDKREELEDYLRVLEEDGIGWTPRSIDLTRFDVKDGEITYRWFPYSERTIEEEGKQDFPFVLVEMDDAQLFTGEDLDSTFTSSDNQTGYPALGFTLKASRAGDFGEFTGGNIDRGMAIILDGVVDSAPNLEAEISSSGQISGGAKGFTIEEVKALRTVLSSGSLQVKPERLSKATIGPTLGETSIRRGVMAGIVAAILVVAFMMAYYMGVGLISCLTLTLGMYLLMGGLGFLEATLTLPGIAGILLTVGMAVDQNILINERIREERKKGKTLGQSVKNGFERAFVTIVDAQATTFIAGFILYQFGTGPIRGFAVTLMLGIITTMFASLVGAKALFAWSLERDRFSAMKMRSIIGDTNIRFTRYLRPCLIGSLLLIVTGIALFAKDYRSLQGLDFAGGFQARIVFKDPQSQKFVFESLSAEYDNPQVVTMLNVDGEKASEDRARHFRVTMRADENETEGSDRTDEFQANIEQIFGDYLLPKGIDNLSLTQDTPNARKAFSFTLNFDQPIEQTVIEGRLSENLIVTSVAPTAAQTPADSFQVELNTGPETDESRVRTLVTTSLLDLPSGVRMVDPFPESQFIGGKVGKELTNSAIKAIIVAIFFILIYIRIRFFDFIWGIAACVAVVHDVLIGLAAVALVRYVGVNVQLDLTMIGAFLTIVGYSLNDTIVIFDRVRENLPRMNKPLDEVVNVSINQTLSRTLLTSITTLVAVVVLFAFNYGQRNVLEGFSFVIMVGVLVGTYSTIFIASPMLVWLTNRKEKKTGKKVGFTKQAPAATT